MTVLLYITGSLDTLENCCTGFSTPIEAYVLEVNLNYDDFMTLPEALLI